MQQPAAIAYASYPRAAPHGDALSPRSSADCEADPLTGNHGPLELAWSSLSVTAPKRTKPIIPDVSGMARSGELLAGPSSPAPPRPLPLLLRRG